MDKLKYCKHFMFWTAIVVAIALAVIAIPAAYIIAPLFWHIKYDGKDDTKHLGMD